MFLLQREFELLFRVSWVDESYLVLNCVNSHQQSTIHSNKSLSNPILNILSINPYASFFMIGRCCIANWLWFTTAVSLFLPALCDYPKDDTWICSSILVELEVDAGDGCFGYGLLAGYLIILIIIFDFGNFLLEDLKVLSILCGCIPLKWELFSSRMVDWGRIVGLADTVIVTVVGGVGVVQVLVHESTDSIG